VQSIGSLQLRNELYMCEARLCYTAWASNLASSLSRQGKSRAEVEWINPEVQEEAGPPARGTSRRAGNLAESLQIKGNLRS
jgi:hypothetical protein